MVRSVPKSSLLFLAIFELFFLSCGRDQNRYYGEFGYVRTVPSYVQTTPYVWPSVVPIVPRPYPYRYRYVYDRYPRWRYHEALVSYLDCRAYGQVRVYRGYRCCFPRRYRFYEIVSRYLDSAMEEFWHGRRDRGGWYLSQALDSLPSDDPMAGRLEEIQTASARDDSADLAEMTIDILGEAALKMVSTSSPN